MLGADIRMGAVHLSVADLERSVAFYESALGLAVTGGGGDRVTLGADLLVMSEVPGAVPADGYAGLFHFALLVPERIDLARWLLRSARSELALTGMSDHFVSEAIYLRDPDGHGIEVYWDRPRVLWEGQVAQRLTTAPLDVHDLVSGVDSAAGLPDGTVMGHVHLRVADVPSARAFYVDELGFEEMAVYGREATFLSVGGYHHHLGANTWQSAGAPPAPEGTARLERFTIIAPDAAPAELVDPSGNRLTIRPAG
jgi:catechol 2,3-dioxygenase